MLGNPRVLSTTNTDIITDEPDAITCRSLEINFDAAPEEDYTLPIKTDGPIFKGKDGMKVTVVSDGNLQRHVVALTNIELTLKDYFNLSRRMTPLIWL